MHARAFCPACGTQVQAGQAFCQNCGAALADGPDPRSGTTLRNYTLADVIAGGGMGVVYRAYDTRLERNVALKLLRDDLAADPEFRTRFLRESRAAAALDHQNILPVFDAGEVDGVLYIATRLVDGMDLRQRIAHDGALALDRALAIVGQLAAALDFAHSRQFVHRDVKPANVLLVAGDAGDDEHAYLIDFGITKHIAAGAGLTMAGQFVGTPEYVSPEQVAGRPVDGRADQYALACVLFHCLTGAPPYARDTAVDVLHAQLHDPIPPIDTVRGDLPASVGAALGRALSKDPFLRFETCRAFVSAARAGPADAPVAPAAAMTRPRQAVASRTTMQPPAPPPARSLAQRLKQDRAPRIAAIVAVVALLAGAGVATGALLGAGGDEPGAQTVAAGTTAAVNTREAGVTAVPPTQTAPTPTTATPVTTTPAPQPTPPPARSRPALVPIDVAELELTPREKIGFTVAFPAAWDVVEDDVRRPGTTEFRRSRAVDRGRGHSLLVDHLVDFERFPRANRAALDADSPNVRPGYRRIGFREYDVNGRTGFEWRYRFLSPAGREIRRVDVFLREGRHDFAVLAEGRSSYDDLSALVRAVAESIVLTTEP